MTAIEKLTALAEAATSSKRVSAYNLERAMEFMADVDEGMTWPLVCDCLEAARACSDGHMFGGFTNFGVKQLGIGAFRATVIDLWGWHWRTSSFGSEDDVYYAALSPQRIADERRIMEQTAMFG